MERDAARRAVEAAFHDAPQTLGAGEARNRAQHAVERTIPFGLLVYTVVIVWSTLTGHHPADTDQHRTRARWYTTKTQPAFEDMTAKLRRVIIAHRIRDPRPHQPQPKKFRPSSPPGQSPEHDHRELRNTRPLVAGRADTGLHRLAKDARIPLESLYDPAVPPSHGSADARGGRPV